MESDGQGTGEGAGSAVAVRVLPPSVPADAPGYAEAKAAFNPPPADQPPQPGTDGPPDDTPAQSAPAPDDESQTPAAPDPADPQETPQSAAAAKPARRRLLLRRRFPGPPLRPGPLLVPLFIFLALFGVFGALAQTGKPLRLPVWAVAEAEARINRAVVEGLSRGGGTLPPEAAAVSLGGIVLRVDRDWVPRLALEDLRLLQPTGEAMVVVPEARASFDPDALLRGQVRLASLGLIGPRFVLQRAEDGQFDIALGLGMKPRPVAGFAGLIDAGVGFFSHPALSSLTRIEAEALSLSYDDRTTGRRWDMGDGQLRLDNRTGEVAMQIGLSLAAGGASPARADLTLVAAKASSGARLTVRVDQVAAADIAAQAPPLAFLGVVDAPISGQIAFSLDSGGKVATLEATLDLQQGALRPQAGTAPVEFDSARLVLGYDPARERMDLREVSVQGPTLRLTAAGHAYLPGVAAGRPREVLGQVQFSDVALDPEGLFAEPLRFEAGALDLRLRLDPFRMDIGQLSLRGEGRQVTASGNVQAGPDGWRAALDMGLDHIAHDRLLALWPREVVPRTRDWISQNVLEGQLSNLRAAFRLEPGEPARLSLGYDFSDAQVRFLRSLPPITGGKGYAVVEGKSYLMRLSEGIVTPPQGGAIDAAGSVFAVPDVSVRPALAEISLRTRASLTATLSLLDQPPFNFLTKARQPVALGEGRAETEVTLRLPLQRGVTVRDVAFDVAGRVTDFRSTTLVPDRVLTSALMTVTATPEGLTVSGAGELEGVPFDATYRQKFGPEHAGRAQIEAVAELSPQSATRLKLGLPDGLLQGRGKAEVAIDLRRGNPPALRLSSDLAGVGMAIPALGWTKAAGARGRLQAEVRLGKPAQVQRLTLEAAGLTASGAITLNPDNSLQTARFDRVRLGGWLDAAVDLAGRGRGRAPAVSLTGGTVDLRGLPARREGGTGAAAAPLQLALDRLVVTDTLALTGFRSQLGVGGAGVSGDFTARVNGAAPIRGSLAPTPRGAAVRIRSDSAGDVFSAARIFPNAVGGSFDLVLNPTGATGEYDGALNMTGIRVRNVPALAELLSAVSVVGLLEQMNGEGLLFSEAEAEFRLTPKAIQITRGSAVGASMGVSVEGLYRNEGGRLDMQGVISPLYLLNGIGSILTRRGEGLFGFNYRIGGTVKQPEVSVNPLSIFTPGMFREIFRSAPPRLEAGQ